MKVRGELKGYFAWNGWHYGYKSIKRSSGSVTKYYKSKTSEFDDKYGETLECDPKEYTECAEKYYKVFKEF